MTDPTPDPLITGWEYMQSVAANVRARAAARQVSQAQLAEVLDLAQGSISRRMRGDTPWGLTELGAIATLLGCSPSDLTRVEA